jgi:hypothetical protein
MNGIKVGYAEYQKLYKYQNQPGFIFLHTFCRGRSGSAMRAIGAVLKEKLATFANAVFIRPDASNTMDKQYMDLLSSDAAHQELLKYFKLWGLDNADFIDDYYQLSANKCQTKDDPLTNKFAIGEVCKKLFSKVCFSMAPLPTSVVIVELGFSQMKNVQKKNESQHSVDQHLAFVFNVLKKPRDQRRKLVEHTKNKDRHLHTMDQCLLMCDQARALTDFYRWESMSNVPGHRAFIGNRRREDALIGERTHQNREAKAKKKNNNNVEIYPAEYYKVRQLVVARKKQMVQLESATVDSLTASDRGRFVVLEQKMPGQVSSVKAFWSSLKATVLLETFCAVVPLCAGDHMKKLFENLNPKSQSKALFSAWGDRPSIRDKSKTHNIKQLEVAKKTVKKADVVRSILNAFFVGKDDPSCKYQCPYCFNSSIVDGEAQYIGKRHVGGVACYLDPKTRCEVMPLVMLCTGKKTKTIALTDEANKRSNREDLEEIGEALEAANS